MTVTAQTNIADPNKSTGEAVAPIPGAAAGATPPLPAPASPAAGAATVTPPTAVPHVPTRKLLSEADDDVPSDAELLEMSPKAFKSRIERHGRKTLKEKFGTDNVEEIVGWKAKLDALEKQETDRKLAEMSEVDRLKALYETEKTARTQSDEKYRALEESRVIESEDRRVMGIMGKHFSEDYLETEVGLLSKFLAGCTEEDLKDSDILIDQWCADRVSKKPWLGRGFAPAAAPAAEAAAPAVKQEPVRVPITNGVPSRPGTAAPAAVNKTAAPGRANSMSDSEYRAYLREQGIQY